MSDDKHQGKHEPQPSRNPNGSFPHSPDSQEEYFGRNVDPESAREAAREATEDLPVTPSEVVDQAAYKGDETDVGQQAELAKRAGKSTDRDAPKDDS